MLIQTKSATALFTFPYSDDLSGIEIQHFNFGRPVLDFIVGDDGVVVVSLDGQWICADADATGLSENSLMVRTVKKCSGEVRISCLLFIPIESVFSACRNF
jgi:tRNA (guanine-N(7)-)-methyltransferase subunit TRM82